MNKNTKLWLNYLAGAAISLLLLWSIYGQVIKQLNTISTSTWLQTGPVAWLVCAVGLMFVNTTLEGVKWYLLCNSVAPASYSKTFSSYLAGVAFSIITPNRVGEYPGRILYLGSGNTFRYINISVLGVMAQLLAVYIFGLAGLIYFNFVFPAFIARIALAACILVNVFIATVYWRFETWLPVMAGIRWLKRFSVYGRLLNRVTTSRQILVLGISLLRFAIFTAQYLFLLRWLHVDVPLIEGYFLAALFFWIMAVIPGIALTELGIRGSVALFLFQHCSPNTVGVLAATAGLWLLNLILPSVAGSILIFRMKLVR